MPVAIITKQDLLQISHSSLQKLWVEDTLPAIKAGSVSSTTARRISQGF